MKNYNNDHDENNGFDETEENKPKKKFKLFGNIYSKDGPGVEKDDVKAMEDPSIINFFKLLWRKLGRLVYVNAFYILGNFPIIFFLIQMSGYVKIEFSANAYSMFPAIYGTSLFEPDSPLTSSLLGIFGRVTTGYAHTTLSMILLALSFLVIFTFGPVNAGTTYILRSMVREEPVFLWSDFTYAIKRNWKQAIPMGIIDSLLIFILVYDVIWFNFNAGSSGVLSIMLALSWAMLILYFFMRLYIYLMMTTFDLKMTKIFKNAVYFSILGFKRNFMALIGIVLIAFITIALLMVFLPIGIVIPFTILFSLGGFIGVYCAYPKIKQIMIDPYYAEHPDEMPDDMKDDMDEDIDPEVL